MTDAARDHEDRSARHGGDSSGSDGAAYLRFGAMIVAAAVVMYVVMYFNTYSIDHVYFSWTRLFMTMMSTATMAVIMLAFMRHMYRNRNLNLLIVGIAVALFGSGLWLVRSQATIGDVAWMEGMIPHHSIAILTSENAHLTDPRVRQLAESIIEAQRSEIAEMKDLIKQLEGQVP